MPADKAAAAVVSTAPAAEADDVDDSNTDPLQEPQMSEAAMLAAQSTAGLEPEASEAPSSSDSGSSVWVIIGSIVGIAAVAGLAAGGFFVYKKKKAAGSLMGESAVEVGV